MDELSDDRRRTVHPVDLVVGRNLHMLRTRSGFTQQGLAQAMNVTFQQIQKYEKCVNRISAPRLYDAARALGVDVQDLFEGLPEQRSPAKSRAAQTEFKRLASTPEGLSIARAVNRLRAPAARKLLLKIAIALEETES